MKENKLEFSFDLMDSLQDWWFGHIIGEDIGKFLEKYDSIDKIQNSLDNFILEFKEVINILKVRTESEEEEEGVYGYWLFF